MTDEELLNKLQDLDLTKYQSKAYIAAVRVGQATPSELVDASGVPQGRIYDVISSLEELGLVEVRSQGRGKVVRAPSPQTVLEELKRRRIDNFTNTVSTLATELERVHQRVDDDTSGFVTMVKREETALRHAELAIEDAEYWLTICVPDHWYEQLATSIEDAVDRGVTVRVLFMGTDPQEVGRDFPAEYQIRYRATADTFVGADRTYGIFSSKHPAQDRQPYIITQEPNLVLLFQDYAEQVWYASRVVQRGDGFPRRYLDPWRAVSDLHDRLDAGDTFYATVQGRSIKTQTADVWEGPIIDYGVGGPADVDYTKSPPTWATLTIETDDGPLTVGGWKATLEDIAATGIEIRTD